MLAGWRCRLHCQQQLLPLWLDHIKSPQQQPVQLYPQQQSAPSTPRHQVMHSDCQRFSTARLTSNQVCRQSTTRQGAVCAAHRDCLLSYQQPHYSKQQVEPPWPLWPCDACHHGLRRSTQTATVSSKPGVLTSHTMCLVLFPPS